MGCQGSRVALFSRNLSQFDSPRIVVSFITAHPLFFAQLRPAGRGSAALFGAAPSSPGRCDQRHSFIHSVPERIICAHLQDEFRGTGQTAAAVSSASTAHAARHQTRPARVRPAQCIYCVSLIHAPTDPSKRGSLEVHRRPVPRYAFKDVFGSSLIVSNFSGKSG